LLSDPQVLLATGTERELGETLGGSTGGSSWEAKRGVLAASPGESYNGEAAFDPSPKLLSLAVLDEEWRGVASGGEQP
jgi:hypothetical protein